MNASTKVKLVAICLLSILVISLLYSDKIQPSNVELYTIKRLQEKTFMSIKSSPIDKINYYNQLLDKRLEEFIFLVSNKEYDYFYSASLRYATTAGLMVEMIKSNDLNSVTKPTLNKFMDHQKIIQKMYDSYPHTENDRGKFIQDIYNYLEIYISKLSS